MRCPAFESGYIVPTTRNSKRCYQRHQSWRRPRRSIMLALLHRYVTRRRNQTPRIRNTKTAHEATCATTRQHFRMRSQSPEITTRQSAPKDRTIRFASPTIPKALRLPPRNPSASGESSGKASIMSIRPRWNLASASATRSASHFHSPSASRSRCRSADWPSPAALSTFLTPMGTTLTGSARNACSPRARSARLRSWLAVWRATTPSSPYC